MRPYSHGFSATYRRLLTWLVSMPPPPKCSKNVCGLPAETVQEEAAVGTAAADSVPVTVINAAAVTAAAALLHCWDAKRCMGRTSVALLSAWPTRRRSAFNTRLFSSKVPGLYIGRSSEPPCLSYGLHFVRRRGHARPSGFSPEQRAKAVPLVAEAAPGYPSQ